MHLLDNLSSTLCPSWHHRFRVQTNNALIHLAKHGDGTSTRFTSTHYSN